MPDACSPRRDVLVLDEAFGLIGRLDGVHIDPDGEAWGTVHCATADGRVRLVPLRGTQWWSGYLRVACSRQVARTAPCCPSEVLLGDESTEALREHYAAAYEREQRFRRDGF